jgi:predicted metal-dependent HD superfamily phosphohydrolase
VSDQQIDRTLRERWTALAGPGNAACGQDLVARYREPHRRYHTTEHLAFMLDVIDLLADEAADDAAVRYAAWFHDAVYEIEAGSGSAAACVSNEERSARLAEAALPELGVADELVAEVGRLVRLTAGHDPAAGDRNGAVLCDADLAVLGGSPEQYRRYREQVREEYQQIPDELYRPGRAAILRGLLALPELYRTERARKQFGTAAMANLAAEIAALESVS